MNLQTTLLAGLGMGAVALMLVLMGLLSRRLGRVTHAVPHYRLFFIASGLVTVGALARFGAFITQTSHLQTQVEWVLVYNGLPALGLTLAVISAWYYWSWLLAERD